MKQLTRLLDKELKTKKSLEIICTAIPKAQAKNIIGTAIREEWKRKWINARNYKHTKFFFRGPNKKMAKRILKLSRVHLTKLIAIITGFNCLSYKQFKADPTINPLRRLC